MGTSGGAAAAGGAPGGGAGSSFAAVAVPRAISSGEYVTSVHAGTAASVAWTLGEVRYVPVDIAASGTYVGLACCLNNVGVGGTSPLIHMSVYADDGTGTRPSGSTLPGTEVTLDPTTVAGERYVAFAAPVAFNPGRYWFGLSVTSGSALSTMPNVVTATTLNVVSVTAISSLGYRGWASSGASNHATMPAVGSLSRAAQTPFVGMKLV